jgi:general L-amino acid transport system substrate-binding protein
VQWVTFATFQAEELGVGQANVDDMLDSDDVGVQRLLGTGEDDLGALMGLPKDWGYQVISQVGNYGEIYDRTLEPIGLSRAGSPNDLWTRGGLLYSPAFR